MAVDLRQTVFRFGSAEGGTEANHAWLELVNTNHIQYIGANWLFLLRLVMQEAGGTAAANATCVWNYKKNGAGSVIPITTTSACIQAVAVSQFGNGDDCTQRLSGTGTFVTNNDGCTEDGSGGGSNNDIAASGNSEQEAGLQVVYADVAEGDYFDFYYTSSADSSVTYTVTPRLTIHKADAIETLRPNAAGDETALTKSGGASNWEAVDEATADDTTTFVYGPNATSAYFRDLYNLPAHSVGSGTINAIIIYFRCCGTDSTTAGYAKPSQKSGATVTDGTEVRPTPDTYWSVYYERYTTNPATGLAYTWDEIDALQIGVCLKRPAASRVSECTQVWVEIDYTPTVIPTVTTQAASGITSSGCTGNGNITNAGGENCTRRGFCYKVGTSGDPTTADSVAYDDGSYGTGAYTKAITGLSSGTGYRVRAYAVNSAGTGYGSTVQVTTLAIYDETGKEETMLAVPGIITQSLKMNEVGHIQDNLASQGIITQPQAMNEVGHLEAMLAAIAGNAGGLIDETGCEQVVLITSGIGEQLVIGEVGHEVTVLIAHDIISQVMTMLEIGKAVDIVSVPGIGTQIQKMLENQGQSVLAEIGESEISVFPETGHEQTVLLASGIISQAMVMAETGAIQVILVGSGESERLGFTEILTQVILTAQGASAGFTIVETSRGVAVIVAQGQSTTQKMIETGKIETILAVIDQSHLTLRRGVIDLVVDITEYLDIGLEFKQCLDMEVDFSEALEEGLEFKEELEAELDVNDALDIGLEFKEG